MERYTQLLFKQKHPSWVLFAVLGIAAIAALFATGVFHNGKVATQVGELPPITPSEGPVLTPEDQAVEYVSNELLIKIKSPEHRRIKKDAKPEDTGLASLNKLNKEHGVQGFGRVAKPSKKSRDPDHDVFRWYKVTFPGPQKIVTEPLNLDPTDPASPQPESPIKVLLARYQKDSNVEAASLNYIVHTAVIPNDTYADPEQDGTWSQGSWGQPYEDLWGLKKIEADKAWDITTGSQDIVVAVIDTGIDYNHPDIAQNIWTNPGEIPQNGIDDDNNCFIDDYYGFDFVNSTDYDRDGCYDSPGDVIDSDPMDDRGHGTHVAGTIGAVGNNNLGVVGVNWTTRIMVVKFLDSGGGGTLDNGARALQYAADNGARVSNNSWGCSCTSQLITDAVLYEHQRGMVVVAAAGNSNADVSGHSPASIREVITVSAFDHDDKKTDSSNWGTKIDVAAPGGDSANESDSSKTYENILSLKAQVSPLCTIQRTIAEKYCRVRGTSMASPHVAGLAALILSQHPNFTNEDVRQLLRASADDVDTPGFDIFAGYGRINASRALEIQAVLQATISRIQSDSSNPILYDVEGTASGTGFVSYDLLLGAGDQPQAMNSIYHSTSPVQSGLLGQIDSSTLTPGVYTVELAVTQASGFVFRDRKQFSVARDPFGSFSIEKNLGGNIPVVSSSGATFVVAWARTNKTLGVVRVSDEGAVLAPGVQNITNVEDGNSGTGAVAIASTGDNSLVVFNRNEAGCPFVSCPDDLYGARIGSDGNILDTNGFPISTKRDTSPFFASVATDGTNYLAVWSENKDIYGARITAEGTVLDPNGFIISSALNSQWNPKAVFDGTNYFVVWEDRRNDPSDSPNSQTAPAGDLYAARVSPAGVVIDPDGIALLEAPGQQRHPRVVFTGNHYVVVWQDNRQQSRSSQYGVWAMRVDTSGNTLDPGGLPVSLAARDRGFDLGATALNQNTLVVWEDQRNGGDFDIYAARIGSSGVVIDPEGFPVLVGPLAQANPDIASLGDKSLVVWQDTRGIYSALLSVSAMNLLDSDADGFTNAAESFMGTDPLKACPATSTANDEPIDPWPPDFNDDGVVQIEDVTAVSSRFGAKVGDPKYSPRYEVASQDGVIHIDDVTKIAGAFGKICQ